MNGKYPERYEEYSVGADAAKLTVLRWDQDGIEIYRNLPKVYAELCEMMSSFVSAKNAPLFQDLFQFNYLLQDKVCDPEEKLVKLQYDWLTVFGAWLQEGYQGNISMPKKTDIIAKVAGDFAGGSWKRMDESDSRLRTFFLEYLTFPYMHNPAVISTVKSSHGVFT